MCQLSPPPPLHPHTPQMCSTPKELREERKEGKERGLKGGTWGKSDNTETERDWQGYILASLTCF